MNELIKQNDFVNHELVIAKLAAYALSESRLGLIQNYLLRRTQWLKKGSSLSGSLDIAFGLPEGSILEPILFNIFINDLILFIIEVDVCNFADDTTLYKCGRGLELVSHKFEMDANIAIHCLKKNEMVANPKMFQLIFLARSKNIKRKMSFGEKTIYLRIQLSYQVLNINFKSHIENIYCKVSNKIRVLFGA